jgi:hypothetical protein
MGVAAFRACSPMVLRFIMMNTERQAEPTKLLGDIHDDAATLAHSQMKCRSAPAASASNAGGPW